VLLQCCYNYTTLLPPWCYTVVDSDGYWDGDSDGDGDCDGVESDGCCVLE
jgi:hypothetical protein